VPLIVLPRVRGRGARARTGYTRRLPLPSMPGRIFLRT